MLKKNNSYIGTFYSMNVEQSQYLHWMSVIKQETKIQHKTFQGHPFQKQMELSLNTMKNWYLWNKEKNC